MEPEEAEREGKRLQCVCVCVCVVAAEGTSDDCSEEALEGNLRHSL